MKHLLHYNQINEGAKLEEFVPKIVKNFSKDIDTEDLLKFLMPYKNKLDALVKKYLKGTSIDGDQIMADLKSFNFGITEKLGDYGHERWRFDGDLPFDEDDNNNVVLRYLYKFFIGWPKAFAAGLWDIFKATVVETFQDGGMGIFISIMAFLMWIIAAVIIFIVSLWIYQVSDHALFGLKTGNVTSEVRFEPRHTIQVPHTYYIGKTMYTYYTTEWVDDRWHTDVKGGNGRTETWVTYNRWVGEHTKTGSEVTNDDNWSWEWTDKR